MPRGHYLHRASTLQPNLDLFFLIFLASKFRKLGIRDGERRVPPFTEKTVISPRPEETLGEAKARMNEIIESEARIAMFEEMPCVGPYAQWGKSKWTNCEDAGW